MAKKSVATSSEGKAKRYMKMKELSEATGVKGHTIRFYISQGILPKPEKPHKNMAYYDEGYIGLIKTIKRFQKEHFLPLEVIKKAIDDLGFDQVPSKEDELTHKLFQAKQLDWVEPTSASHPNKPVNKKALSEISKISPKDLERCLKAGILIQDESGLFDVQNVKVATLIAQLRQHLCDERGFSFDFIALHNNFFHEMADRQFKYFLTLILKGKLAVPDANELALKCVELLYLVFPLLHRRYLNKKIKESLSIGQK
jgi:DNA-binding transcriptional MerR regulator